MKKYEKIIVILGNILIYVLGIILLSGRGYQLVQGYIFWNDELKESISTEVITRLAGTFCIIIALGISLCYIGYYFKKRISTFLGALMIISGTIYYLYNVIKCFI